MKKTLIVFVAIISLFLITGCGIKSGKSGGGKSGGSILNPTKTMTCTKVETDDNGHKTSEEMVITYNSKKVLKVHNTQTIETDAQYRDFALNVGKTVAEEMSKVEGIEVTYTGVDSDKVKMEMDVEFEKVNLEQLKEALGDLYDEDEADSFYGKKDITIEEFKKENLEGYNCK